MKKQPYILFISCVLTHINASHASGPATVPFSGNTNSSTEASTKQHGQAEQQNELANSFFRVNESLRLHNEELNKLVRELTAQNNALVAQNDSSRMKFNAEREGLLTTNRQKDAQIQEKDAQIQALTQQNLELLERIRQLEAQQLTQASAAQQTLQDAPTTTI
ncbi:MAG: hypothetical protein Q8K36_04035, partial [Alphaproteobacteria bacterium]|nr:hypothetical protein [Alphaproteobacteria bacterium]